MSQPPEGAASRLGGRLRRRRTRAAQVEVLGPEVLGAEAADAQTTYVYAGLVTRAIAFALDASIVNLVAAITGVVVGLGVSILHLPEQADAAIAAVLGVLWVIWSALYFALFWSTTGETPGNRVLGIRVIDSHSHKPVHPTQGVLRYGGIILAAIPLGAGFIIMLWDDRGRALQDRLARTVVIDTSEASAAASPATSAPEIPGGTPSRR